MPTETKIKDSLPGCAAIAQRHHSAIQMCTPRRMRLERRSVLGGYYPLLMNIFLFYLLSFFNTALKKLTPKCPIIQASNTLCNQT